MKENAKIIWDGSWDEIYNIAEEYRAENEDMDESDCEEMAVETVNAYRDDEKTNLDIETERDIIMIADLGLWSGRKNGGMRIPSRNINVILDSHCNGELKVYCDSDLRAEEAHHDGINYYTYRMVKEGVDAKDLMNRFAEGDCSPAILEESTESLADIVKGVYGW